VICCRQHPGTDLGFAEREETEVMNAPKASRGIASVILFNQYNLVLVAAALVFSLALASPWPAIVGAGAELLWLAIGFSSRRARRWAARHVIEEDGAQRASEIAELQRILEPAYAARVHTLESLAADIRRLARERDLEAALVHGGQDGLQTPVLAFARMAALHQRLSGIVGRSDPAQLEEEIMGLGQSLSREQDASVHFLLSQALTVAQGRLQQQEQLGSHLRGLGVRMGTLEMSFDYIRSYIVMGKPEKDLTAEVAQLIGSLRFVSEAEAQVEASVAGMTRSTMLTAPPDLRGATAS
jgi:hypothetical protein